MERGDFAMSTEIDKRIVEMHFQNEQFNSGVDETVGWLDKLKNSLKLTQAAEGLEEVGEAADGIELEEVSEGVDSIASRFSALGIIGMTVLQNITNRAVDAGMRIAKALTIDPIKSGLSEYELKMDSIQTILTNTQSKGTTLDDVNSALEELNLYADKTIYNFAQMTQNIGRFTAAGVDLDTSVASIKGISNLAAASGSSAAQASTAMYQLSQALAAGKVNLQDWNSVVNAGMGGELFQNALKRTSRQLGTGVDEAIKKYGTFRESLTKGQWLTTDVLTETLKQLSGAYTEADLIKQGYSKKQAKEIVAMAESAEAAATDVKTFTQLVDTMKESVQSGWAVSWEHIIGDKEESKELFTNISKGFESIIGPSTEARNAALKYWNDWGGRAIVIKSLTHVVQQLGKIFGAIGDAFSKVFPPMTGPMLVDLSKKFRNLTSKFKVGEETVKKLKTVFEAFFNVIKMLTNLKIVFSIFGSLFDIFKSIGSVVLNLGTSLAGAINWFTKVTEEMKLFEKVGEAVKFILSPLVKGFDALAGGVDKLFGSFKKMDTKAFSPFLTGIKNLAVALTGGIGELLKGFGKMIGSIDLGAVFGAINLLLTGSALPKILDMLKSVGKSVEGTVGGFKDIFKNVSGILGDVRETLQAYQDTLQAGALKKIGEAILMLAAGLLILSLIDPDKMDSALVAVTILFAYLNMMMASLVKMSGGKKLKNLFTIPTALLLLSGAMLLLVAAVKQLSKLNPMELATGIAGVTALMVIMSKTAKTMGKSDRHIKRTAASMIIFGVALNVMALAVRQLSGLSPEQLFNGLLGVGIMMAEISLFIDTVEKKLKVGTATGILILSVALIALAKAVEMFGTMKIGVVQQGLGMLAMLLLELAIFTDSLGKSKGLIKTAIGLNILAPALKSIAEVVKSLGEATTDQLINGILGMAGGLLAIAAAMNLMPKSMIINAVGLVILADALKVLADIMVILGKQSWEEVARGSIALLDAILILALGMTLMTKGMLGAAAMVVMAAAMQIFIPQLIALGKLPIENICYALLALFGVFSVLAVSAIMLKPALPVLAGLAGVLALMGLTCMMAGAGLMLVATALGLLAASGAAGGLALVEVLRQLLGLLPTAGKKMGEMFTQLAVAIGENAPAIIEGFGKLFTSLLDFIVQMAPQIAQSTLELVIKMLEVFEQAFPKLIDIGTRLIVKLLEGISSCMDQLIDTGVDIVVKLINGIASNIGELIDAGFNLIIKFINGLSAALDEHTPELIAAGKRLFKSLINAGIQVIKAMLGPMANWGKNLIMKFINGIKSKWGEVKQAAFGIDKKIDEALRSLPGKMLTAGKDAIKGFISGLGSYIGSVASSARQIGSNALSALKERLGINSPSREFAKLGSGVIEGFVKGMNDNVRDVKKPTENIATTALAAIKNPMNNLMKVFDSDVDMNPVITPVLDLSNVQDGAKSMNGLLAQSKSLSLSTGFGTITSSMSGIQNGNTNDDVVSAIKGLQKDLSNMNNNTYQINGVTYDDGSNITNAVETLVRAAKIERRV